MASLTGRSLELKKMYRLKIWPVSQRREARRGNGLYLSLAAHDMDRSGAGPREGIWRRRDLEQAVHFFNIAAVAEDPVRSTFTRDCVVEGILTPDRRRLHESALTDSKSVRLEKLQKGS